MTGGERTSTEARVEALIERGLDRYGEGDLIGAISEWEAALSFDPEHERAREYVDYVRQNFEQLEAQFREAREVAEISAELDVPFGLESVEEAPEDEAYDLVEIEVRDEQAGETPTPLQSDHVDEGWVLDPEGRSAASLPPPPTSPEQPEAELTGELELGATEAAEASDRVADDGVLELEAEPPGAFELEEPLDLWGEREPGALGSKSGQGARPGEFGSDATRERTIEVGSDRARASSEAEDDEEVETVPGGEEPPPFGEGLSLSEEALQAISAGARPPGPDEARRPPDETTAERPDLAAQTVAVGELDQLELGPPRDDRATEDSVPGVQVRFRPGTAGAGADEAEGELTVERRSDADLEEKQTLELEGRHIRGALTLEGLDDEMTVERSSGSQWNGGGTEAEGTVERASGTTGAGELDLEEPTGWKRGATEDEATIERRQRDEFDVDTSQQTNEMPQIDIGMAPLNEETMSMDAVAARLSEQIDRDAPADESESDRTRRRVSALIKRAESENNLGSPGTAVTALDLALDEAPDSAVAQKAIHRHRDLLFDIYQSYIGDMDALPTLAIPLHQLAQEQLDSRAAFLLSRVDGSLSFEEIVDVSGMSRLECYRLLSKMLLRGILEVH